MKINILFLAFLILNIPLLAGQNAEAQKAEKAKPQASAKADSNSASAKAVKNNKAEKIANKSLTQEQVLQGLISWDKKLKTLQASFDQSTSFEETPISASQGIIFKQGENIRLDTLENGVLTQSATTDKKIIKIKDASGELITTLPWEEWRQGQTNQALFDFGNYEKVIKEHKVKDFAFDNQTYNLVFIPLDKSQEGYELTLKLDPKDFFIKEIILQNEGVQTKTTLKEVRKNIKFKESIIK